MLVRFPSQDHFERPCLCIKTGQAFLSIMDTPIQTVVYVLKIILCDT